MPNNKKISGTGNRTPSFAVKTRYVNRYTIPDPTAPPAAVWSADWRSRVLVVLIEISWSPRYFEMDGYRCKAVVRS